MKEPKGTRLKSKSTIWNRIRRLDLPEPTKQKLRELWSKSKALVQSIIEWICNRSEFCSSIMLGVALACLVSQLPVVGSVLSTLTVSLAFLHGLGRQFNADLSRHFHPVMDGSCA